MDTKEMIQYAVEEGFAAAKTENFVNYDGDD